MNLSQPARAWIYRVLVAVGALLLGYGLLDSHEAALWLGLAWSILGNGLAAANTSTSTRDKP